MPSIDERIVQMQFDNKEFEKNIQVSLKSLEDLKKGLELDEAGKSLKNIEKVVSGFDMSGIGRSIETIAGKFSNLGIIGVTALQRISNAAIDAGTKLVRSISIDQVNAGMSKYEMKTTAVQTMRSALPEKSVKDIENVLDVLNKYTDETSYDFATMAQTIGKFVANGVELEVAERAMEGIANEAAKSGAGISEANRAMYNFAQALASGSVKLIDWRSIQNANMATKEFKEQIIQTAMELGVLSKAQDGVGKTTKGTEVTYKTFESTLSESWFTSEVLIKTLEKYADQTTDFGLEAFHAAQQAITFTQAIDAVKDAVSTNWMKTFQAAFGDLEEAIKLWTGLCNALIEFTDRIGSARIELLEGWHEQKGYNMAIEAARNLWDSFLGIVEAVSEAIASVFPPTAPETLVNMTERFRDWTASLKESLGLVQQFAGFETIITKYKVEGIEEWKEFLRNGAKGEDVKKMQERLMQAGYALDKFGADGIFGPETEKALKQFQKDMGIIEDGYGKKTHEALGKKLGLTGREGIKSAEKVEKFVDAVNPKLENFQKIIQGAASVVKLFLSVVGFGINIGKSVLDTLSPIGNLLLELGGFIGDLFTNLNKSVQEGNVFSNWLETINSFLAPVKTELQGLSDAIRKLIFGTEEAPTIFGKLRDGSISLKDAWNQAKQTIKNSKPFISLKNLLDKVSPGFDKIKTSVKGFYKNAKAYLGKNLIKIMGSLGKGFSTVSSAVIDFVTFAYEAITGSETLKNAWETFKNFISSFGGTLKEFGKAAWDSISAFFKGKSVKDVWEDLKTRFGSVGTFLSDTFAKIKERVKDFISQSPLLNKLFETIGPKIEVAKASIKSFIEKVIEAVNNFLGTDTSNIEGFWEKMKERLKAFDPVVEYFADFKEKVSNAYEEIKKTLTGMGEGKEGQNGEGGSFFDSLKATLEGFAAQFEGFDIKGVLSKIAIGIGAALLIKGLSSIGNLFKGFKNFSQALLYKEGGGAGNVIKSIGNALLSAGGSVLMVGAGVALVVLAIKELIDVAKETDKDIFDKAKGMIEGLLGIFAGLEAIVGVSAAFGKGGLNFSLGGALSVALGLYIIVEALSKLVNLIDKRLGTRKMGNLKIAIGYIRELIIELGTIEAVTSFGGLGKGFTISGALSTAIGLKIVVGAIASLAKTYETYNANNSVFNAIADVKELIIELGAIDIAKSYFTTGALGGLTSGAGPVGLAYGLKIIVGAIGDLAKLYDKYNGNGLLSDAILDIKELILELGSVEVAAGAFTKNALGQITGGAGAIGLAYALEKIINAFAEAIPKIKDVDPTLLGVFAGAVEVTIPIISAALTALSKIKLGGSINIVGVFGALAVAIAILGSVTSGVVDSFSSTIELVGWRLNDFSDSMSTVDPASFGKAKGLIELMANLLMEPNVAGAKADSFALALERISGSFALLGLSTFGVTTEKAAAIKGISDNIEYAVNKINNIQNADKLAGIVTEISGAIALFFNSADGVDLSLNTDVTSEAIRKAIEGLAKAVPSDESLSQIKAFAGESESSGLNDLAIGIQNIATALKSYGDNIGSLNLWNVFKANMVLTTISSLKDHIEHVNLFQEFASAITGKSGSFGLFIVDVAALGLAIRSYGLSVGTLDQSKIELANSILTTIGNIKLESSGGLWQALVGTKSLGNFAVNISDIGTGLSSFMGSITDTAFNEGKINAALKPISILAEAQSKMKDTGGLKDLIEGSAKFETLGKGLNKFVAAITKDDFLKNAKNIKLGDYNKLFKVLNVVVKLQQKLAPLDGMASADYSFGDLSYSINTFLGQMSDIAKNEGVIDSAAKIGSVIDTGLGNGISSNLGSITSAISKIPSLITSTMSSYFNNFVNVGKAIDMGIAKGIIDNTDLVDEAIKMLIEKADESAREAGLIESPSRLFAQIGYYLDAGLAMGLFDNSNMVSKAASSVIDNSIDNLKSGLTTFSNAMLLPLDDTPTIRPVLDLTDVNNGITGMNGLFGDRTVGVRSTSIANSIANQAYGRDRSVMSSDTDSVSVSKAISTLNEKMASLEVAITNMKVVTETGALIGQIASGMDNKLGEFARKHERGG